MKVEMANCLILKNEDLKTITKQQIADADIVLLTDECGRVEIVKCRYGKTHKALIVDGFVG